jgi:hypothetical protein
MFQVYGFIPWAWSETLTGAKISASQKFSRQNGGTPSLAPFTFALDLTPAPL